MSRRIIKLVAWRCHGQCDRNHRRSSNKKKVKKMSYESRIDAALKIISDHNDAIGVHPETKKPNPGYINSENFLATIKAVGGTSEDRLTQFSHEDIIECLKAAQDFGGIPRIIAKAIASAFRNKKEEETSRS